MQPKIVSATDRNEFPVTYHGWVGKMFNDRWNKDELLHDMEVWQRGRTLYGRTRCELDPKSNRWKWWVKGTERCWQEYLGEWHRPADYRPPTLRE